MESIIKGGGQGASKSSTKSKMPSPTVYFGKNEFKHGMVRTPSYTPAQWKTMQETAAVINAALKQKHPNPTGKKSAKKQRGGRTRKNRARKSKRRKHSSKRR